MIFSANSSLMASPIQGWGLYDVSLCILQWRDLSHRQLGHHTGYIPLEQTAAGRLLLKDHVWTNFFNTFIHHYLDPQFYI